MVSRRLLIWSKQRKIVMPDPTNSQTGRSGYEYRVTYEEHGRLEREACGLSARTAQEAAKAAEARGATDVRVWSRPTPAKWEELER